MNDLLTTILKNITTKPEAAKVSMQPEGDVEVYTIEVDPEDVGRVIGKSGKVIRAIRSLAHVAAVHTQKKVRVHLDDSNAPAPQAQATNQPVDDTQPTMEAAPETATPAGEVDLTADAQPTPAEVVVVTPEAIVETPDTADLLPEEPAK